MPHIVITGASFAGIPIAHSLLKDIPSVKVTLINPSSTFYFAIGSSLEVKQAHSCDFKSTHYFDITEDMSIDTDTTPARESSSEDATLLLYSPLPADLPTVDKDLLILMAAYYGDIDRYVRVRRPIMIEGEFIFVIRGIFHNTMFAKWWSLQDLTKDDGRLDDRYKLSAI
ncbi:hypothetical protein BDW75DRAFT_244474 [Aspergillus navahoensis]